MFDCDCIINFGVIVFFEWKGDVSGVYVIKLFYNWYKVVDGRGLFED